MQYRVFGFIEVDGSPQERELVLDAADEADARGQAEAAGMVVASVELGEAAMASGGESKWPVDAELRVPRYAVLGHLSSLFLVVAYFQFAAGALGLAWVILLAVFGHEGESWLVAIGIIAGVLFSGCLWLALGLVISLLIQTAQDARRAALLYELRLKQP